MDRFKNTLYTKEIIIFQNNQHQYKQSDDGTLFSGNRRTKILAQDLPEWYVYGRYYKRWGYLSTKGITDLLYISNRFVNHYLKDDCLHIAYGGKISETDNLQSPSWERYSGYDHTVWGSEIISVLRGASIYSEYDISGIIQQLKEKKEWLIREYPDEFGPGKWSFDVDACFSEPFQNGHPPRYYAITLENHFCPGFVSSAKRYYGTLDEIGAFINELDTEHYRDTIDAYQAFQAGNKEAAYIVAQASQRLLEPVTLIKDAYLCLSDKAWDFTNAWDSVYPMRLKAAYLRVILIKDGNRYFRCIQPVLSGLQYKNELSGHETWESEFPFWGHPGILFRNGPDKRDIHSRLYLPEKQYDDVKQAVAELKSEDVDLNVVCEEIFGDG